MYHSKQYAESVLLLLYTEQEKRGNDGKVLKNHLSDKWKEVHGNIFNDFFVLKGK
jgi:hypothetical protein